MPLQKQISARPELRVLSVNHNLLLVEAFKQVPRLAVFFGEPFDVLRAAVAIRPELRRQKV